MEQERQQIRIFNEGDVGAFVDIFDHYLRGELSINLTDEQLAAVCNALINSVRGRNTWLDLLFWQGRLIGFINYQIDSSCSDWCERAGWGFIREVYVRPEFRGTGRGGQLVRHAEGVLRGNGAKSIYLTSENTGSYWQAQGYKHFGEFSRINKDPIYEKVL